MTNYRRKRRPKRVIQKRFIANNDIKGTSFRVIDEEGAMVGVLTRLEAFTKARELDLDLIEINPKSEPPVVKMMEFTKFKYQMSKAGSDKVKFKKDLKIIRVSVRVSDNDLKIAANKAEKFLEKGLKVKLQVQMRGREKVYPDIARDVMEKLISMIEVEYIYENTPSLSGDSYHSTIKTKKQS